MTTMEGKARSTFDGIALEEVNNVDTTERELEHEQANHLADRKSC